MYDAWRDGKRCCAIDGVVAVWIVGDDYCGSAYIGVVLIRNGVFG